MRPSNSSPVVTRLLKAHGIVLGKTNLEELAEGLTTINPVYGPVLNPYNNLHDVGGKLRRCRTHDAWLGDAVQQTQQGMLGCGRIWGGRGGGGWVRLGDEG